MKPKPNVTKIDSVNWVERTIPTGGGPLTLCGPTVRALKAMLDKSDPDDLVIYMAEVTEEMKSVPMILGVIGGSAAGTHDNLGVTFLFGPEGTRGMRKAGMIDE